MALEKHPRQLLVLIVEAALEKPLLQDVRRLGAHGYTVSEVRGGGSSGEREGAWEPDLTVRIEVICEPAVADAIAASSPVSWQHINLHGEFDFSDESLKDSLRFDLDALFAFRWEAPPAASPHHCFSKLLSTTR